MILVTVGTQLPFDRLIKAIDELAAGLSWPVVAQIGKGSYIPKNMEWVKNIEPSDFDKTFSEASVIVSHAGIGTVMTARRFQKPIILFPRRASYGEHRNEHQLATVRQLENRPGIYVAYTTEELAALLTGGGELSVMDSVASGNESALVSRLREFVIGP